MIDRSNNFFGLDCTIVTTDNCNLRCKYCYELGKIPESIDEEYCYKFIDLCMEENDIVNLYPTDIKNRSFSRNLYNSRIFDFVGGDALIDPDLLDRLMTYINTKYSLMSNKLPNGWRASISTNGTLFKSRKVRDFLRKWYHQLSLGVSIDGCPELHDLNRIYVDGRGSMKDILIWWPWLKENYPGWADHTKSTLNKDSIPYIYDSLVYMHEILGIKYINQNFIFEDMHLEDSDLQELDNQWNRCENYIIDHRDNLYYSPFDRKRWRISSKILDGEQKYTTFSDPRKDPDSDFWTNGWCGSGMMPTLAIDGNIYPCLRWTPSSQVGCPAKRMSIGNIMDLEHLDKSIFTTVQKGALRCNCTKDPKCLECPIEPMCSYCIAGCYQEYGDFIRQTHICEVHKLEYKHAKSYWRKFDEVESRN